MLGKIRFDVDIDEAREMILEVDIARLELRAEAVVGVLFADSKDGIVVQERLIQLDGRRRTCGGRASVPRIGVEGALI